MRLYQLRWKVPAAKYNSIYMWCENQDEGIAFMLKAMPRLKFLWVTELMEWGVPTKWLFAYFKDKPRGFLNTTGLHVNALGFEVLSCPYVWVPTREEKIDLLLSNN